MKTEDSINLKKIKKVFILKKYKSCFDKGKIIKNEINNYLKTEKILESNDKILIGKLVKQKGPRFDKNKKIIPYSFVGSDRLKFLKRRKALKNASPLALNKLLNQNKIYNFNKNNYNNNIYINDNNDKKDNMNEPLPNNDYFLHENIFKVIDNEHLNIIYQNIYNKIKKNKTIGGNFGNINNNINSFNKKKGYRTLNNKLFQLPDSIRNNLIKQENILKNHINFEKIIKNINKTTLKKLNNIYKVNKVKKDLLLNAFDNYNNSLNKSEKILLFNNNLKNWNFKLRNPKINGLYERKGYFKTSSSYEELYSTINLNKQKEIFVNPFKINKKNIINLIKKNKRQKYIESLESLKVDGNNLFEYEFRNEMKLEGKKKLYDLLKLNEMQYKSENKEKLSDFEIEKNIKELYKDKIIANDYINNYSYSPMISLRKSFLNSIKNN